MIVFVGIFTYHLIARLCLSCPVLRSLHTTHVHYPPTWVFILIPVVTVSPIRLTLLSASVRVVTQDISILSTCFSWLFLLLCFVCTYNK